MPAISGFHDVPVAALRKSDSITKAFWRFSRNQPASTAATAAPMIDLTPEQLAARLTAGNIRLIDVRTAEEVAEGMIPGAEHIPLDAFDPAKLGPPDGREVVLYCRSGRRSAIAGAKLAAATGAPVEQLAGGILAWEQAGFALEPR